MINVKYESVYREILYRIIDKGYTELFTQKELSKVCSLSISTVYHAIKPLSTMNLIQKHPMGFKVIDPWKLLLYWSSIRNLEKETVLSCRVEMPVEEIESCLPNKTVPTAYTGFKLRYGEPPADYSEVVVYGNPETLKRRYKCIRETIRPNLIVLKPDAHINKFKVAPTCQIFADLWNLNTWYANEHLKRLEEIINGILARLGYREE